MRCILPCAGYGTRMGMRPNQSKEMLPDPNRDGYVIDYALDLCQEYGLDPLVVSRADKTDLNFHIETREIEHVFITPFGEWPDTILATQNRWDEHNLLILPDTRFKPTDVIQRIRNDLENGCKASVALHSVTDAEKWCVVRDYDLIEKPKTGGDAWAMGLVGWHRSEGTRLFKALSVRNNPYRLMDCGFQYLDKFVDITRTGVIEPY